MITDLQWCDRIQGALHEDSMELFLQSIVSHRREPQGVEALIRMRDAAEGYVSPAFFLPAAQRTGLMALIDRWVLDKSLQLLKRAKSDAQLASVVGGYISVNLSAKTLSSEAFISWALDQFAQASSVLKSVVLELTETEEGVWGKREIAAIQAFRTLGIRVVLDDFGMGYNSFSVLKCSDFDGIKLDHQVSRGVVENPIDRALIGASVEIARSLGIQLVAEGVEEEVWLRALLTLGVKSFQGYLFDRPQPVRIFSNAT